MSQPPSLLKLITVVVAMIIIALLLTFISDRLWPVHAHAFYAPECCAGRDCHPVDCDEIRETLAGWLWQDHITFPHGTMHVSEDGGCHVCVPKNALTGTCIYLPPRV